MLGLDEEAHGKAEKGEGSTQGENDIADLLEMQL